MATQTKARAKSSARSAPRERRSSRFERQPSLADRAERAVRWAKSLVPDVTISYRLQREMLGVAILVAAVLTAGALGQGTSDGRVIAWWGRTLNHSVGEAAPLVPFFMALTVVRVFRLVPPPILELRHYLGGFAFAVAVTGLLQLSSNPPTEEDGGYLGVGVATLVQAALGEGGAGLALLALGAVAVFLLAGTDLATLGRDLRALPPPRLPTRRRRDQDPLAAPKRKAEPAPVARPKETPRDEPKAAPPRVINVPVRPVRATEPGAPPKLLPPPSGEPLPLPDIGHLAYYDNVAHDTEDLDVKARRIEETLSSFKVDARVREVNPGPAVTQFALEPGLGIKVRRITELQNDLALALAAPSIRIEAPIPGLARVGLEIPNAQVATVGLRDILESNAFVRSKAKLPLPLGRDVNGNGVVGDLAKMPHLLIAGATGSGKSVCLNVIISTFLLCRRPDDLKLLMIDPKTVELTGYNGVPHLLCPVVTEMDKVVGVLRLMLREMERRYTLFSRLGVRNLDGYRMKVDDEPGAERLPHLVVIIDELADLMMTAPEEVETLLVRLAQKARATGIHLILATQRPSVDVITGLIKANVPARIAFAVASGIDSRVVLDMPGAERLLGRGDMLYLPPDAAKPQRIQGAFIDDDDVHYVVDHWHAVTPVPAYAQEWLDLPSSNSDEESAENDPLMEQALEIVRQQGTASASMLQRRLRVGYNRAARLIERMEDEGVIGPADGLKGRPFLGAEE